MNDDLAKKQYRTVGIMTFVVSIALLVMRIITYYVQIGFINASLEGVYYDLLLDAIFTVPVQIGILLVFPFLLYKFALKKSPTMVLTFSGYRKCNIWVCLLAVLIGFFVIGVSYGLSIFWQIILILLGFDPSGGSELPETFNFGYFILTVLLTAVLPAVCEEFTNRGGLLTTLRSCYSEKKTILLIAIAFGLFHQNITQLFYTMVLGGFLAYIVLKTGSIYPAMIIHFMNNFMSIYLDNASTYNWPLGGGFDRFMTDASFTQFSALFSLCLIAVFALTCLAVYISKNHKRNDFYIESYISVKECDFRPRLRDNIFFIGAIVVTAIATFITFVFGL